MTTPAQPRIEQLGQRPDLLPIVAAWIYNEWWIGTAEETAESLTGKLGAHLTQDRIPLTLVASLELRPVGTVTLLDHDVGTEQWPERSPWLAALYVVPEYRRRGIGAALVNAAAAKATALGVETLYLATMGREGFYGRLGWKIADRADEQVVMSKHVGRRAP
jgi:predicted N-acetyltransferase YhbS